MKINVSDTGVCQKQVRVEVAPDAVAATREDVLRQLQRVVRVPGFRVGHAPRDLIVQHYRDRAREETIRRVVGDHLPKALEQAKLDLLGDPEVVDVALDDGQPMIPPPAAGPKGRRDASAAVGGVAGGGMTFTARCEIMPAIAVRHVRGLTVTRPAVAVTDARVEEVMAQLVERQAELVPVDPRPVAAGDFAVVDFTCTVEGNVIEQRTGTAIAIKPEEDPSGMSRHLVGVAPGAAAVTFESMLPADLPAAQYAGKPATFTVTLKEIKAKRVPALDEAFAKGLGAESLEALRARVRDDLTQELTAQARRASEEQIVQHLLDHTRFDVPASLVQSQARRLLREAQLKLIYRGVAPDDVKGRRELLADQSTRDALRQVKVFFLLRQIAKDQQLMASPAEIEQRIQSIAARSRKTVETVRAELAKERLLGEVAWDITRAKTFDFLLSQAEVKEQP